VSESPPPLRTGAAPTGATSPTVPAEYVCPDWQWYAAHELARVLSVLVKVEAGDVFEALSTFPNHMLDLLNTQEGWSALARFVAADFGHSLNTFQPTRH
jgi:hypothetical protein